MKPRKEVKIDEITLTSGDHEYLEDSGRSSTIRYRALPWPAGVGGQFLAEKYMRTLCSRAWTPLHGGDEQARSLDRNAARVAASAFSPGPEASVPCPDARAAVQRPCGGSTRGNARSTRTGRRVAVDHPPYKELGRIEDYELLIP